MLAAAAVLAALGAVPALADVKAGVEAWSRGDYAAVTVGPARPAAAPPAPVVAARTEPTPVASAPANGLWRVQLGAFAESGNADRLWSRLSGRAELAGRRRLMVPAGRMTKLQAGGFPSRAAADAACRSLKQSGQDCLVTDR